ncbi:hypothetical protein A9Y57_01960 [Streptococcus parauberis]|uniref:IrrE N-terminal-like domain-containing protein n=1 Tax=Streptococcus parauberis TaxID=1348 RepID=A0A854WDH9_9STRE|nr:ImmA/IrrE family metallo-endopeptidase [Streptococcus parauberis]PCH10670.1 hypothetical protein A9Y57_01960 [Streptococcus parauberis]
MQYGHLKIWKTAHNEIYNYIKLSKTPINNYTFKEYFNYVTSLENIIVFEHHFPSTKILGVTHIDEDGKTISYEKDSIEVRQNFTKCHEIGHIILNHEGGFFTEQINNKNPKEIEADNFSAIILAPDIVLLQKILIERKTFHQISIDLKMSYQSLQYRLSNLAQKYGNIFYEKGNEIALEFKDSPYNSELLKILYKSKEEILKNFQDTEIDPFKKLQYLIYNEDPFISNYEIEILSRKDIREKIDQRYPNYKSWAYHNMGKTIWFCWNTLIISKDDAIKTAKRILYNDIYKKD